MSLHPPTLSDVLPDRASLAHMSDFYKELKSDLDVSSVKDLVPLSTQNDPVYLQPANIEKAEWFAELWEREGHPTFHPRGFFYELLGKGYTRPNGDPIDNSSNAWVAIQKGAKWAQILGLVPGRYVRDEKNPDPTLTVDADPLDRPLRSERWGFLLDDPTGYSEPVLPSGFSFEFPSLRFDDAEALTDHVGTKLANELLGEVFHDIPSRQPYYLEVWAEKGGLLPEDLLREYGATIRPAGGGEFSLSMCRDAVSRAAHRDQGLVVVLVTDFDPKGADMPKSAARKIELEAAARDVEAHVHHAALTAEQVEKYDLPGEPGKVPDGDGHGVKAYNTHKELFRECNGYPVEVNAFTGREPDAFRAELERYLSPYYDETLESRYRDSKSNAKRIAHDEYLKSVDSEAVTESLDELQAAAESYRDEMAEAFDEAKAAIARLRAKHDEATEATGLDEHARDLESAVKIDTAELVDAVAAQWDIPTGEASEPPEPPLLDTRRSIVEQIKHYQEADIRYQEGSE